MTRTAKPPLRTQGGAWGQQRIRLGISMRDLERRAGINRAVLSLAEQGRLVPKAAEYDRVMQVLREEELRQGESATVE